MGDQTISKMQFHYVLTVMQKYDNMILNIQRELSLQKKNLLFIGIIGIKNATLCSGERRN